MSTHRILGLVVLGFVASLAVGDLSAQVWLEWQDVTATNMIASPSVGANDIEEKDFATGDLDLDGDIDLLCVR